MNYFLRTVRLPQRRQYPESGFFFLALIPLLQSAAAAVAGGALSAAGWMAVEAAMSPRSEEEQQAAVSRAVSATQTMISIGKWTAQLSQLWQQLERGILTGERAYEARLKLERFRDFIALPNVSDIEREAAYQMAKMSWGELVAAEAKAKGGAPSASTPKTTQPSTTGGTPGNGTTPVVQQDVAASGGGSSAGTVALVLVGLVAVGGGIYLATRS